jgi:anhydro-N-acetylmuramic acid kinase
MVGVARGRSAARDGGPVRAAGIAPDPWGRGLVAAGIETDGHRLIAVHGWAERGWSAAETAGLGGPDAALAAEIRETAHAQLLARFPEAAIFGVFERSRQTRPLPRCDGAVLAAALDRPVVWDFAATEIGLGGQGAPLTGLYHHALLRHLRLTGPAAVLALDRIPRLTWADCGQTDADAPGACLAFDTGPALPPPAAMAAGTVHAGVRDRALTEGFLNRMPPRLLAPTDFARLRADLDALPPAEATPTLLATAAAATIHSLACCPRPPEILILTGPGARDAQLFRLLEAGCGIPLARIDTIAAVDPAAVSAQAAAFSAVRVVRGLPTSSPGTSGLAAAVGGGEISRPARPG